ncbi:hypothetical protein [Salisaeta longa]|uniref:hypothetical protein n=1 Tax=Salisaeta longa TaxID=503170 RepID=UPI0003B3CCA9|nr:hypothetical protein [Salisaeta longa]
MPTSSAAFRALGTLLALALLLVGSPGAVHAQTPTTLTVHVLAHDAKLLQDPVGGARVTVRNAITNEILAQGVQRGTSGSTKAIMEQAKTRGADIFTGDEAARFVAELPLTKPTRVLVTAEGPLAYEQSVQRASKTLLMVPGQDITGDGLVLELHGFIVQLLPATDVVVEEGEASLDVRAEVQMLCGCPTKPGGMWDSNTYTMKARLVDETGAVVSSVDLEYAGTPSEYTATVPVPSTGELPTHIQVVVSDADRVNFGMASSVLSRP